MAMNSTDFKSVFGCLYIVPGSVNSLTAQSLDPMLVELSWVAPSYQATGIIAYEVAYSRAASCSVEDFDESVAASKYISAETLAVNITRLEASTCYVFSVRAYSADGYGEWETVTEMLLTPTTDGKQVQSQQRGIVHMWFTFLTKFVQHLHGSVIQVWLTHPEQIRPIS